MAGLYREGQLGEGLPSSGLEKFRVKSRVGKPYTVTGRNRGLLGEPGDQVHFDMNMHQH